MNAILSHQRLILQSKRARNASACREHCEAMQRYFKELRDLSADLRMRLSTAQREIDKIVSDDSSLTNIDQRELDNAQRAVRRRPRGGKDAIIDILNFFADAVEAIARTESKNRRLAALYSGMKDDMRRAHSKRNSIENNIKAAARARRSLGCIGLCADQGQ